MNLRIPGRVSQPWYNLLDRCGKRTTTQRWHGLKITALTQCHTMLVECLEKRDYEIEGFPVRPGDHVIDVGANQGFFTLYVASLGARVWAYEPCRESFAILRQNVEQNKLSDRVTIVNAAVTERSGRVPLFLGKDSRGHILANSVSTLDRDRGGVAVESCDAASVTLASILEQIGHCDWLKMDCEGGEYPIFESVTPNDLSRITRISLEYHRGATPLIKKLTGAGFELLSSGTHSAGILKAVRHC